MSSASIFGIGNPYAGVSAGPGTFGNFGMPNMGGPGMPTYKDFLPSSMDPSNNNTLDSWMAITQQFSCPPLAGDRSDLLLTPDTPAFTVNERLDNLQLGEQYNGTTIVLSIARVNLLAKQQWDDLMIATANPPALGAVSTNPKFDLDAYEFLECLQKIGEYQLEAYANAKLHNHTKKKLQNGAHSSKLATFLARATEDGYCYLTRYGTLQRLSFMGIVITANRGDSGLDHDALEAGANITHITMGIARRVRCAQMFGSNRDVVHGSRVYLVLTRRRTEPREGGVPFGAYVIKPYACPGGRNDYVPGACHAYYTENGQLGHGHVWTVGTVIECAEKEPVPSAREQAANTGSYVNEQLAYQMSGSLPTFYVAVGF